MTLNPLLSIRVHPCPSVVDLSWLHFPLRFLRYLLFTFSTFLVNWNSRLMGFWFDGIMESVEHPVLSVESRGSANCTLKIVRKQDFEVIGARMASSPGPHIS